MGRVHAAAAASRASYYRLVAPLRGTFAATWQAPAGARCIVMKVGRMSNVHMVVGTLVILGFLASLILNILSFARGTTFP